MPRGIPTKQGPAYGVDYNADTGAFSISRDDGATWAATGLAVAAVEGYDLVQVDSRALLLFVTVAGVITVYRSEDGGRTWG